MNRLGDVMLAKVEESERLQRVGGRIIREWSLTASDLTKEQMTALDALIDRSLVNEVRRSVNGTAHVHGGQAVTLRLAKWPANESVDVYITYARSHTIGPNRSMQLVLEER